jgi:hypothetical protein
MAPLPLCNEYQFPQLGAHWIWQFNCWGLNPRNGCNSAIGQFQLGGNWPIGNSNAIQSNFPQFNEGNSLVGFARKPRHAQIPETGPATSDRGPLPAQRAILILGAEPVGQPSPDTITTAVRLAPRPLPRPGGGGGGECARGKGAKLESNGSRNGSGRLANGSSLGRSRNGARRKVPFCRTRIREQRHLICWHTTYWTASLRRMVIRACTAGFSLLQLRGG